MLLCSTGLDTLSRDDSFVRLRVSSASVEITSVEFDTLIAGRLGIRDLIVEWKIAMVYGCEGGVGTVSMISLLKRILRLLP